MLTIGLAYNNIMGLTSKGSLSPTAFNSLVHNFRCRKFFDCAGRSSYSVKESMFERPEFRCCWPKLLAVRSLFRIIALLISHLVFRIIDEHIQMVLTKFHILDILSEKLPAVHKKICPSVAVSRSAIKANAQTWPFARIVAFTVRTVRKDTYSWRHVTPATDEFESSVARQHCAKLSPYPHRLIVSHIERSSLRFFAHIFILVEAFKGGESSNFPILIGHVHRR